MPDPKPTHPVARAIWEALRKGNLTTDEQLTHYADDYCWSAGKILFEFSKEAEAWDRVATEAESAHRREGGE